MAGMLAVFAEFERDFLRERVKARIAHARASGKNHGRPQTAATKKDEVLKLHRKGLNNSEIARRLKIGRSSVIRVLNKKGRRDYTKFLTATQVDQILEIS